MGMEAMVVMSIVGAAMSGYGMIQQRKQGKKMASAEKDRAREEKQLNLEKTRVAAAKNKKEQLKLRQEANVKRADILSFASNSGATIDNTSAFANALDNLNSDFNSQQSYLKGVQESGTTMSNTSQRIGDAASRGSIANMKMQGWQNVTEMGGNLYTAGGGFSNFSNPFETPATKTAFSPTSSANYS
tara:strand:- start:52 stop:612 length:561 start_codon:yes stop_codon:yes gene_type:complete